MTSRRVRDDEGQLVLLIVVFFLICGLLTIVAVEASAVFLAHRDLQSAADGAALQAAQAVDLDAFFRGEGDPGSLPLDGSGGAGYDRYVAAYQDEHPGSDVRFDVEGAQVNGRPAVRVTVSERFRLPFAAALGFDDDRITLTTAATAESPLR
jgi:hypothetical protein